MRFAAAARRPLNPCPPAGCLPSGREIVTPGLAPASPSVRPLKTVRFRTLASRHRHDLGKPPRSQLRL